MIGNSGRRRFATKAPSTPRKCQPQKTAFLLASGILLRSSSYGGQVRHLSFVICHLSLVTGTRYFNGLRNLYSANASSPVFSLPLWPYRFSIGCKSRSLFWSLSLSHVSPSQALTQPEAEGVRGRRNRSLATVEGTKCRLS